MIIYGVVRADRTIVDCLPAESKDKAFLFASHAERAQISSGNNLRVEKSFGASCWRANGEAFNWSGELAREIGLALGYEAIQVRVCAWQSE